MPGQGNIILTGARQAGGGGGGTVNAADNGLFLLGTTVKMGGPLLQNTVVNEGLFSLGLGGDNGAGIFINPAGALTLGDWNATGNGVKIDVKDASQQIQMTAVGGSVTLDGVIDRYAVRYLGGDRILADVGGNQYGIGDIDGVNNSTALYIGDGASNFLEFYDISGDYLLLRPFNGRYQLGDINAATNGNHLFIDDVNQITRLGDVNSTVNGSHIVINDAAQSLVFNAGGNQPLQILSNAGFYQIGFFGSPNNTTFTFSDPAALMQMYAGAAGGYWIEVDGINETVRIGDDLNVANGTVLTVDDQANQFIFKNTANTAGIQINGVAGFTGTVTPVVSITVNNGIVTAVT